MFDRVSCCGTRSATLQPRRLEASANEATRASAKYTVLRNTPCGVPYYFQNWQTEPPLSDHSVMVIQLISGTLLYLYFLLQVHG